MRARVLAIFPLLLLSLSALAQEQDQPNQTLARIRQHIAEKLDHLPSYMCTETVNRENFILDSLSHAKDGASCAELSGDIDASGKKGRMTSSDRLRLDVALSSKSEMYSWVGEGQFDDRDLSQIVGQGTTSTGAFGSFLRAIFTTKDPEFSYQGEDKVDGRAALIYDFVVPLSRSGYSVSNGPLSRMTGYSGSFAVDAESLDLLRLNVLTDRLPPELRICRSRTTIRYTETQMNGADVLIPAESQVWMVANEGRLSANKTTFSNCHQFMGESTLIFDTDAAGESNPSAIAAAKSKTIRLRNGLRLSIVLAHPIDPAAAAAGDPITGKLTHLVRDKQSGLLIPKGATVYGRIFGITVDYGMADDLELGLKWDSIELDGSRVPLQLLIDSVLPGSVVPIRGRHQEIQTVSRLEQPGLVFFLFPNVGYTRIPAGFGAEWITASQ